MSSDLRDRLEDLAAHPGAVVPPANLWDRGVRRRRLERAASGLLGLVVVLLLGLGGWGIHLSRDVQPADSHGTPHLPDRFFYDVSPWTHPFDGPPGPLVTVFPHERKTLLHTTSEIVGVTASSGTYGFLDLPDDAVPSDVTSNSLALSPDGRRLAFWVSGTPSGSPNTTMIEGETVTGVAVYDAVDGRLRESRSATVHGLEPRALLWADDSTLLFSYGQIQGRDGTQRASSSGFGASAVWTTSSPRPQILPENNFSTSLDNLTTRATEGEVVTRRTSPWLVADASVPTQVRSFRTDRAPDLLVLSPDHHRAVGVLTHNRNDGPLVVTRVPRGDDTTATLRRLTLGDHWTRPLAWLDNHRVAVFRQVLVRDPVNGPHVGGRLESVDLTTGGVRRLVANVGSHGTNDSDPWIATGLLGSPSVHAEPPPAPPDLRAWTIGLGVAAALTLFFGLLVLRGIRVRRA